MNDEIAGLRAWEAITRGDVAELRRALEVRARAGVGAAGAHAAQGGVSPRWKHADEMDRSLLHHAAAQGRVAMVQLLLERGASLTEVDEDDASPLHRFCWW